MTSIRNDDSAALAALLRLQPSLTGLARRVLAGRDGSEDAVQEAWQAVLAGQGLFEEPRTFARRVGLKARALGQRDARRRTHERAAGRRTAESRAEPAAEAVERAEARRVVLEETLALEPHLRDVLVLRFIEERDVADVATTLGIAEATVRTRVHRALPKLRERLERRLGAGREGWLSALAPLALSGTEAAVGTKVLAASVGLPLVAAALAVVAFVAFRALTASGPGRDGSGARTELAVAVGSEQESRARDDDAVRTDDAGGAREPARNTGRLRVAGTVVGSEGAAPGAALVGVPETGFELKVRRGSHELFKGRVETDARGRFDLTLDDRGDDPWVRISAEREAQGPWRAMQHVPHLLVPAPDGEPDDLEPDEDETAELANLCFELVANGSLVVRFEDTDGRPLEGVRAVLELGDDDPLRLEERVSDGAGRTEFSNVSGWNLSRLDAPGRVIVEGRGGDELDAGGFEELVLVLAETAALRVQVVDGPTGAPLSEVRVSADVSSDEPSIVGREWGFDHEGFDAETDANGFVELEGLPSARRLGLVIEERGFGRVTSKAIMGAELVVEDAPLYSTRVPADAEPLRLLPGERRLVRASLGSARSGPSVVLRLVDESGAPLDHGWARLFQPTDVDPWDPRIAPWAHRAATGVARSAQGERPGEVVLRGPFEYDAERALGLEAWGQSGEERCRVVHRFDVTLLDADPGRPIEVVVPQKDRFAGRLDGHSRYVVQAQPVDALARSTVNYTFFPAIGGDGSFRTEGHLAGGHRLFATRHDSLEIVELGTYAAGALDLRLTAPEPSWGRLVVELGDESIRAMVHASFCADSGPPDARPRVPRGAIVDPVGVLPRDRWIAKNLGVLALADGTPLVVSRGSPRRGVRAVSLSRPGWVLVVVEPMAPAAGSDVPDLRGASSGWFRYDGGDVELAFELLPAAQVAGRVAGLDPRSDPWVAAIDAAGRRVEISAGEHSGNALPVASTGRFRIDDAPVGNVRLQFGTRAELDAGRPRREFPVRLARGANPRLELE